MRRLLASNHQRYRATGVVTAPAGVAPINTQLPLISGVPNVGVTLTGSDGAWSTDSPITFTRAWKRDGTQIATGSSYTLVSADKTHAITFEVTATNTTGPTVATSLQTDKITDPPAAPPLGGTTVTNDAQLLAALGSATGGETIYVAAGTYSGLGSPPLAYSSPVTVTALDRTNPPTFINCPQMNAWTNLSLSYLSFTKSGSTSKSDRLLWITNSSNISITKCTFTGENVGGVIYNQGLYCQNITGLTITGNTFQNIYRAVVGSVLTTLVLSDNDCFNITGDAFDPEQIIGGYIERNQFTMNPDGSTHPDAIQLHTNAVLACQNVQIADNLIMYNPPTTPRGQGIFISGQYASDPTQRHQNLSILRNIAIGCEYKAIQVYSTDNATIDSNAVYQRNAADGIYARLETNGGTPHPSGVLSNNTAPVFINPSPNDGPLTISGNVATGKTNQISDTDMNTVIANWRATFRP